MHAFKNFLLTTSFILIISVIRAQAPMSTPVQDIRYEYNQTSGTNASSVVWVPAQQMYVTAIAGNEDFPLEGFDTRGENIFSASTGVDMRGMWLNPSNNSVEINAAGEIGWYAFSITNEHKPTVTTLLFSGQNQPDFQSVGTYDVAKKKVIFLDINNGGIKMYKRSKPSKTSTLKLSWGAVSPSNLNMYSIGFTGHSGYEYVVLDYVNRNLIFFNGKGALTATVHLPASAPVNDTFAFSFTNDRAFLYDKDNRIWYGYKVF